MNLHNLIKNGNSLNKIKSILTILVMLSVLILPIELLLGFFNKIDIQFVVNSTLGVILLLSSALFIITKSIEIKNNSILKVPLTVKYTNRATRGYENSFSLTSCSKDNDFYKIGDVAVPSVFIKELDEYFIYLYPENSIDDQTQVKVLYAFSNGYCLVQDESKNKMITHSENLAL